ncbi:MAG: RrF2 family transcriptional regulator [bacterium]|nr:RrF2 family transcriptional regulator [bacterium]
MKLSTKGRYGLRAILDLAVYGREQPVSIKSIAMRQEISEGYLEQLIAKLKRAELVESVRGAGGGYRLARPAEEISVGEVLCALEGDLVPVDCGALEKNECSHMKQCLTKYAWRKLHQSIQETVNHMYLSDLIEQGKNETDEDTV